MARTASVTKIKRADNERIAVVETKVDHLDLKIDAHTAQDEIRFTSIEKKIEDLQKFVFKHIYMAFGGLGVIVFLLKLWK